MHKALPHVRRGPLKLRAFRLAADMTQGQLAKRVGISHVTVCRVEQGEIDVMLKHARNISAVFRKPIDEVFGYADEP